MEVLAGREKQIADLAGEGLGCKETADRLGLTWQTVRTYRYRAALRLGIRGGQLGFYALRGQLKERQRLMSMELGEVLEAHRDIPPAAVRDLRNLLVAWSKEVLS